MMPTVLYLLLARGGSKGVPRKNLALAGGQPLIAWSLLAAKGAHHHGRVLVSTDSQEVASVAREFGAETPFMRPSHLASDTATSLDAAVNCLGWLKENEHYEPDFLVLLQPSSPLRTSLDINLAMEVALEKNAKAVVSVAASGCHPYWMKALNDQGQLVNWALTAPAIVRRQDLPMVYWLNGAVYVIKPQVLMDEKTWYPDPTYPYVMPPHRSLDVDTPWDLHMVDLILRDQQENRAVA
jgi:CMP-N,N'-diacetyllegionaminic acid synthase